MYCSFYSLAELRKYSEFLPNPNSISRWKDVRIFWGIGLTTALLIGNGPDRLVFSDIISYICHIILWNTHCYSNI